MTIPDHHTALTNAIAALNDANQAEAAAIAKRRTAAHEVIGIVSRLRQEHDTPHNPAFLAVLRHLYWQHPAVPSTELATAGGFRSPQEMTAAIGPVPSGLSCSRCQSVIMRTSRSWKAPNAERWARNRPVLCPGCVTADREHRSSQWRIDDLRRKYVNEAEVTASKDAWAAAVALVLEYPPIAVGGPDEDGPDQFWFEYELAQKLGQRLAESTDLDVAVPMGTAAAIVKEANRLAGWDPERTWDAVTPVTDDAPTAVLTRLDVRVSRVQEERQAEALNLYPDDYEPAGGWTY
ncbi:hypothetical protein ACFUYE_15010 [Micromonospora humida]|uniref:hypothetical protein n=1 Tax=Micromonospora humida TaxID=2809018 RepID=UPI00366FB100